MGIVYLKGEVNKMLCYKYLSMENFVKYLDDYLLGKLYLAEWNKQNDPMEGFFNLKYQKEYSELIKGLKDEKYQYKICALADDPYNFLLWSHYADGHKGVCIEIEIEKNDVKEIMYTDSFPEWNDMEDSDPQIKNFLTSKLKFWEYEHEYRILQKLDNPQMIMVGQVKKIIFGLRSPCKKLLEEHQEIALNNIIKIEIITKEKLIESIKKLNLDPI
jgi:hypothetical protein